MASNNDVNINIHATGAPEAVAAVNSVTTATTAAATTAQESAREEQQTAAQTRAAERAAREERAALLRAEREEARRVRREEQAEAAAATARRRAETAAAREAQGVLDSHARSVRGVGMAATQAGYQVTDFAVQVQGGTSAFTAFSQQAPQLVGSLAMMSGATMTFGTAIHMAIPELTALSLIVTELAIGGRLVSDAYDAMTGGQKAALKSAGDLAQQTKFLTEQQKVLNEEVGRENLAKIYSDEAEALERQITAIEKMARLRADISNVAVARANQEVRIAKQRGGDVALAEAGVLLTKLSTGVLGLNEELGIVVEKAQAADQKADGLRDMVRRAQTSGDTWQNIEKLKAERDKAIQAAEDAHTDVRIATKRITEKRGELLTGVESDLIDKEKEYSGKTTKAAGKAFTNVYQSLKDEVVRGPVATIEQIKVETGKISTQIEAKVTEISSALTKERTSTATSISGLAPTPQDTAAITSAVSDLRSAAEFQGKAIIAALATVTSLLLAQKSQIDNQARQIQTLSTR